MPEPARVLTSRFDGLALRGVIAALPAPTEGVEALAARLGEETARKIAAATGIRTRHLAPPGQTACDMGEAAARELLERLSWDPSDIDLLVVVTQTPDHPLPGNAPLLQQRLGLGRHCGTLDVNSGCSGFVDGLWTTASLLAGSNARRALLVVGDTTSQFVPPEDRNTRPLFGDAVAAIALEAGAGAGAFVGVVPGVDGSGAPYLTVADGASRSRATSDRPHGRLFMDGTQVFAFTLRQVPGNIAAALDLAGWTPEDVDHLLLHQANESMIRHLAAKTGFTEAQTVVALGDYGNTSSASIPLAMATALGDALTTKPTRLLVSGFGVGWRWASAVVRAEALDCCACITLPVPEATP